MNKLNSQRQLQYNNSNEIEESVKELAGQTVTLRLKQPFKPNIL